MFRHPEPRQVIGGVGAGPRRAVLRLSGVGRVPAEVMLEVAEQVRRAVIRLGISEVSIEVGTDEEVPPRLALRVS
jgi:hypothetical protein